MSKFRFIAREEGHLEVTAMCRLLGVSRSGFYAWKRRPPSARSVADQVLSEQVRAAHDGSRRTYGAPRVHAELADSGVRVGRKRVARLMRAAGLAGVHRRRQRATFTQRDPAASAADLPLDRVDRTFRADRPDQLWVADVTYVPTAAGWLYLAVVIDVFSRLVVGWSMSGSRKTELVVAAVRMAVQRRRGQGRPGVIGVIHHSDQGGEYSSRALELELKEHGALASMGSVADCYDNALAESFFASLECELFDRQPGKQFATHRDAKLAIFDYLEVFYNRQRRHSALDYRAPAQHEALHTTTGHGPTAANGQAA